MEQVTKYPHGCFNWVDQMSTDAEASKKFYSGLFGWSVVDNPLPGGGIYSMFQLNGLDVAAVSQMGEEQLATGWPSIWNSYVNVDNVEETTAKAEAAGGAIVAAPFDVMDTGRMSVIADPTGAVISLWEARSHIGAQLCNMPNTHSWNELTTPEPEKALLFYLDVLDWEAQPAGEGYWMFKNAERNGSGMIRLTEDMGEMPAHWRVYFGVDNMAEAVVKVSELGGGVIMGPFDAGAAGKIAIIADPTGSVINIIESERYDPMP